MSHIKRTITLSVLILISQAICASSKPLPGYYITNSGDSVHCNIEFEDWYKNPASIQAKVNNETRTLKASDIKGFGVFEYTDYRSATVTYHTNPINGTELPGKFSDSTMTKTVFLKTLIKGTYSLYELNLTERRYYFVQKNDGDISELLYRVCVVLGEIKEDRQYANTLAGLFMEEDMLDRYKGKIYGASYNSDIISLINILNGKHGDVKTQKAATARWQAGVFAGGMMHFFPTNVNGYNTRNGKLNSSTAFSGGVNLLYLTTGHLNAFKVGLSLSYDSYNSTGLRVDSVYDKADPNDWFVTTRTSHLSVTNKMFMANLYATYTLNPGDRIKFYLKAGLSWGIGKSNTFVINNFSAVTKGFNSGNVINTNGHGTEALAPIGTELINPNGGAGIEMDRHKLEFSYYYPMDAATSNDPAVFKIGMAGIFYYFTILK